MVEFVAGLTIGVVGVVTFVTTGVVGVAGAPGVLLRRGSYSQASLI